MPIPFGKQITGIFLDCICSAIFATSACFALRDAATIWLNKFIFSVLDTLSQRNCTASSILKSYFVNLKKS